MQSAGAGELHVALPGHPASRQEVADRAVGLREVPSPVSIAEQARPQLRVIQLPELPEASLV